jgi:hypothetical protein
MKHLLLPSRASVFSACPKTSAAPKPDQSDKPDLSGTWILDLKASTSLDPLIKRIGATCLTARTAWSKHHKETRRDLSDQNQTGKEGQLIVKRYLINEGKTEVAVFTLQLNAEPDQVSARQIWPKQA